MDVRLLAELIWSASRADEGTISATGADVVAGAIAGSGWLRDLLAEAWADGFEAGHSTARGVNDEYPSRALNPYE